MAVPTIGPYRIERLIKRGGMGAVYLGFDPDLKRRAAIKVLRDDLDGDDDRERFRREAVAIAALDHPNIIRIFHAGVDERQPYIAMEYVHGETLAEVMRRGAVLSLERKLQIVEDVCRALAAAHRADIVHRDIKPANILVGHDGTVKVVDFGIARTPDSALTQLGMLVGTLEYMAPEQFGDDGVDAHTDIYAVGVLLYELIAQKRPFAGDLRATVAARVQQRSPMSLMAVCPDIDADIAAIVATALAHDPVQRYQDVESLRVALAAARQRLSAGDNATLVSPRERTATSHTSVARRDRAFPWRETAAAGALGLAAVAAFAAGIGRIAGVVVTSEPPSVQPPAPSAPGAGLPPFVPVDVPAPPPVRITHSEGPSPGKSAPVGVEVVNRTAEPKPEPPSPGDPKPVSGVDRSPESPRTEREPTPVAAGAVASPSPASPPPSEPPAFTPTRSERQAVADVVERYMQAMSDRDLAAMAEFRRLEPAMRAQIEAQFQELRSWKVTLAGAFVSVDVDGSSATVTGRIRYQDVRSRDDRGGRVKDQSVRIQLRKTAGAWRITAID